MDNTCRICHHVTAEDRYLCEGCEYRAHTWLRTLPRQAALLRDCLQPTTGPAQRGGSGRAHSPLPVDVRVLDLLGPGHAVPIEDPHGDQSGGIPIAALLAGWARYLASEIPAVHHDAHGTIRIDRCQDAWPRTGKGIPAWCSWLQAYLPYAVTRPWVEEMYGQLEELLSRIQWVTHTTPRRTARDAPCPGCLAFALVEREDELHISCQVCDVRLTLEQYDVHRAEVMPALARVALLMVAQRESAAAA
ncbi:hypothetical protein ACFT7S_28310 [Streptomyces sp. NPDC057136]|uniref:hypothetical protein n=1 Tax=Streptomyces sp. NPDC057136 TaxID=3346029 RepID=UPI00363994FE